MGHDWDDGARPPAPDEFHPDNRKRAWVCLLLTVVTVPLGAAAGYAVIEALGYPLELEALPLWVKAVAGLAALAVIVLAPLLAVVFGRRAVRAGDPRGRVPALLGGIGSVLFLLVNAAAAVLS